jgi:small subunit ribosomal protein S6
MLILPAEADEKLVGTAVDRITKAIEPSGGSVGKIDRWGRRRFAYELDHQTEGYYVVVEFVADPADITPLERALTLADEVARAKVTYRTPPRPERTEKPRKAPSQPAAAPTPRSAPDAEIAPAKVDASAATAEPEAAEESSPAPA